MLRRRFLLLPLLALALTGPAFAQAPAPAPVKTKITNAADLPVHTYTVTSKNRPLAEDPAVVSALADAVTKDIAGDLAQYDITDRSTLSSLYGALMTVALLQQDYTSVHRYNGISRSLQDKPTDKASVGLVIEALADALQHPGADFHQILRENVERAYRAGPFSSIKAELKAQKSASEIVTRDLYVAAFAEDTDAVPDTGIISRKQAIGILIEAFNLRYLIPNKADLLAAYSAVLASGKEAPKANIWLAREVTLSNSAKLKPTVVAVWDSGVDISLYKSHMVAGKPGIAFDEKARSTPALLYPLPGGEAAAAKYQADTKGISDFQNGVDSLEADSFKARLAKMTPDQMSDFDDGVSEYESYSHGTGVAGIALRGNPAARLLVCRITTGKLPSIAQEQAEAAMNRQAVAYFKLRGVRVVNMSWNTHFSGIVSGLEQDEVVRTPAERRALARKIYDIGFQGLSEAIRSAPGILFVASAGNESEDILFNGSYPAGIKAPNLIVVGAVNQAGAEAPFTSYGNIDVYANGVDVPNFVPGGAIVKSSGTSLAAPEVTNLAAKLLAENPTLSVAQLKAAILRGADPHTVGGRTIRLLNPKKTLALLNTHR